MTEQEAIARLPALYRELAIVAGKLGDRSERSTYNEVAGDIEKILSGDFSIVERIGE